MACLKNKCVGVFCNENGECINGTCLCQSKYIGKGCENSFASYFAGSYEVLDNETDTAIDTINFSIYNGTVDSMEIRNYANLNINLQVLAAVQNDSLVNIFEQKNTFETEDTIEQQITVAGKIVGKPTDTLYLSSRYTTIYGDFMHNRRLLKIIN